MTSFLKIASLMFLLVAFSTDSMAICKWTDQDGMVHYADNCPAGENTTRVEIEPPPSQQLQEASQRQSAQMQQASKARKSQNQLEERRQSVEDQAVENTSAAMLQQCAVARWQLAALTEQRPVYMDEDGAFHSNQSIHNSWYTGPREYLDDQQRKAATLSYEQMEMQTCDVDESKVRERVRQYTQKQNEDICGKLEVQLAEINNPGSNASTQQIRNLEQVVRTHCR